MTKLRKTTTARVEDALDIVADKIIDLEKTAQRLEILKRGIEHEVEKVQKLSLKINLDELKANQTKFITDLKTLNESYLREIDKKNKIHRPLYYLLWVLLGVCLVLGSVIYFMK